VIESLRNSEPKFLALFAVCTFGIAWCVGMMVRLFYHATMAGASSTWGRDSLEMNAASAAVHVAIVCTLLQILSFIVLALAFITEARGSDQGFIRFSARTMYVLSFIAVVAAISAAVFFIMFHM
jgi:hypothetical protein